MILPLLKFLFRTTDRPVFELPVPQSMEREAVEKLYTRLFASEDGRQVLSHLQSLTFARAYGPDASNEQIRYSEGQRALVATILRLSGITR